jgi:hypothetical protein
MNKWARRERWKKREMERLVNEYDKQIAAGVQYDAQTLQLLEIMKKRLAEIKQKEK